MGHFSRLLAIANELKNSEKVKPEFLIFGDIPKKTDLSFFNIHRYHFDDDFNTKTEEILNSSQYDVVIFDLFKKKKTENLAHLLRKLKEKRIFTVSIDSLTTYLDLLDLIWIPSFYFEQKEVLAATNKINFGWNNYLLNKKYPNKEWKKGSKILVLTGASDISNLGETLPHKLDRALPKGLEITWVRGPMSNYPDIPNESKSKWIVADSPNSLDNLFLNNNYVLAVFGVSFFEALQYGMPTVVFSPYGNKDKRELSALDKERVASVASDIDCAIDCLIELMNNDIKSKKISNKALEKMNSNGAKNLSDEIISKIRES